ncbi:MAG: Type I Iterative PKS [Sarcosagium campestre]|nr:MAG: Type I Iterative PKS [Sarcosagium campestre]
MIVIPVFAGLGPPALFSEQTRQVVLQDAADPEARVLLHACHKTFVTAFGNIADQGSDIAGIELKDFLEPKDLIDPKPRYHKNAVVQNTTLCLVQLLRYLQHKWNSSASGQDTPAGVAGFCSGLMTSVAVASCESPLDFLAKGKQVFSLALWLGLRCEQYKRRSTFDASCDPDLPWSIIVDGLSSSQAENLLTEHGKKLCLAMLTQFDHKESHVYISATNSERCVTLSGRGDDLAVFSHKLPDGCRVRPTTIFSPYHDEANLLAVKTEILKDFARGKFSFPSLSELKLPIFSSIDGHQLLAENDHTQDTLLEQILDMILLKPVNWVSVQDSVFSKIESLNAANKSPAIIVNYGPAYGISRVKQDIANDVKIFDASASSVPRRGNGGEPSLDDIAIVGMAVDLPGAPDTQSLWKVLSGGINNVSEIPTSRFHVEDFYKEDGASARDPKRSMGTKFGNFMVDPFQFDNNFFGISPREAKSIDPQQRVILQTTYKALENAGYVPDATPSFARETFGIYVGNATLDYPSNLKDQIDVYYSPGTLRAFLSGRISYAFGFSGPSTTLDTACSSSMVAIYQACRALSSGDCRAAVAGGVNVITSPDMYLGLDRAHFLSPTGQCKAFDASADGYCRSEGAGMFVLKKMSDALEENDSILGVIKGVQVNQSGNAHSITHPHAPTQGRLFETLFKKSRIDPLDISVVEAHGTGTQAGDPNELESIRSALCKGRTSANPLHITSIKANIGHCEAASGAAALAKLLLMMENRTVPAQILLQNLNPKISPLGIDGATINRQAAPWTVRESQPRLAMLNNFGAAGSNGALIVQEHISAAPKARHGYEERTTYPFGCSAKTETALSDLRDQLIAHFEASKSTISVRDASYTSTARRQIYDHRISLVASSMDELISNLKSAKPVDVRKQAKTTLGTVFLFSGQGSQYLSMGQQLFNTSEQFHKIVLHCHNTLIQGGYPGVLQIINPTADDVVDDDPTNRLQAFQCAIFVLEVALARLWLSWGVVPQVISGHSLGEYAALVTAEVLSLSDALHLVAHRARLMFELCETDTTGMLAVNANALRLGEIFKTESSFSDLSISCYNSPQDCVVGGPVPILQALKQHLTASLKCKSTLLNVPMAYHTKAMDPITTSLTTLAQRVKLSPPKIAVASNVLGRVVAIGENVFTPDYFALHCRNPVAFEQSLEDLILNHLGESAKAAKWIEVGPHPSTLPMVAAKMLGAPLDSLPSMRKATDVWVTLSQALSRLYCSASDIKWRAVFDGATKAKCLSLPAYPLQKSQFYVGYPRETAAPSADRVAAGPERSTGYTFLRECVARPSADNGHVAVFDTPIESLAEHITGHMVCGYALCPASVYHEMALAAAAYVKDSETSSEGDDLKTEFLSNVAYTSPLIYREDSKKIIRISFNTKTKTEGVRTFAISSYEGEQNAPGTTHCKGVVKSRSQATIARKFARLRPVLERKKYDFDVSKSLDQQTFHSAAMYEKIFTRVVTYSEMYQAVRSIRIDPHEAEAFAIAQLPPTGPSGASSFAANPIFMDVLLHVAGFLANLTVKNEDVCICHEVKSATVLDSTFRADQPFEVHCSNVQLEDEDLIVGDAYAIDEHGSVIAVFKGMTFARVKLSKMEAHFRIASKAGSRSSTKPKPQPQAKGQRILGHTAANSGPAEVSSAAVDVVVSGSAEQSAAVVVQEVPEVDVKAIIAEVCGAEVGSATSETDLESMGIDSLMIFELEARLKEVTGVEFESSALTVCQVVGDVEKLVGKTSGTAVVPKEVQTATVTETKPKRAVKSPEFDLKGDYDDGSSSSSSSGDSTAPSTPPNDETSPEMIGDLTKWLKLGQFPELIQKATSKPRISRSDFPLFLIHDGSGLSMKYKNLHRLDRTVWAFQNPRIFSDEGWDGVINMADAYAARVAATEQGPVILGGWSFGGVVAFEAARILMRQGRPVAGVVLIDSPAPINHQPISQEVINAVTKISNGEANRTGEVVRGFVKRQFQMSAAFLRDFQSDKSAPHPRTVMLRSSEGYDTKAIGAPRHPWLEDRSDPSTAVTEWESIVQNRVPVIDIPGNHFEPFEEANVQMVSRAISSACTGFQSFF